MTGLPGLVLDLLYGSLQNTSELIGNHNGKLGSFPPDYVRLQQGS